MFCKSKLSSTLSATIICAISLIAFGHAVSLFERLLVDLDTIVISAVLVTVIFTSVVWMTRKVTSHPLISALMTVLVLAKGLGLGILMHFVLFPLIQQLLKLEGGFLISIDEVGGLVLFQLSIAAGVVICSLLVVLLIEALPTPKADIETSA
jgi:hypothetical protein